jgi:hypothetical protein
LAAQSCFAGAGYRGLRFGQFAFELGVRVHAGEGTALGVAIPVDVATPVCVESGHTPTREPK